MQKNNEMIQHHENMSEHNKNLTVAVPLVDIYENDEAILLHADMPGSAKDRITVNIDQGKLTLTGVRELAREGAVQWDEIGEVEYQRTFSVPQTIDAAHVEAEYQEGVLKLVLPKSASVKPRSIEIH